MTMRAQGLDMKAAAGSRGVSVARQERFRRADWRGALGRSDVGALGLCLALGLRWIPKCNTTPRIATIDFVVRADGPIVGCEGAGKGPD